MMRILILLIFQISFQTQNDQVDWEKSIIGKWEGISKVMIEEGDTVDYTLDQRGYVNEEVLEFKEGGYLKVFPDTETTYELEGDLLRMGNRVYRIRRMDDEEMTLSIEAMGEGSEFWLGFKKASS